MSLVVLSRQKIKNKKRDIMPFLNAHAIIFFKNEQLLRHTFHRQTDGGLKEVKKKIGKYFFRGKNSFV